MVEWLLANFMVTGWSLPAQVSSHVNQFRHLVNAIIQNEFALWIVVILFIYMLRRLTLPKSYL